MAICNLRLPEAGKPAARSLKALRRRNADRQECPPAFAAAEAEVELGERLLARVRADAQSEAVLQAVGEVLPVVRDLAEVGEDHTAGPLDRDPAVLRAKPERVFVLEPELPQAAD